MSEIINFLFGLLEIMIAVLGMIMVIIGIVLVIKFAKETIEDIKEEMLK